MFVFLDSRVPMFTFNQWLHSNSLPTRWKRFYVNHHDSDKPANNNCLAITFMDMAVKQMRGWDVMYVMVYLKVEK